MAVEFQDYYQILNVPKTASQQEIQKSYRRLARTYHPDINKEKGAEEKFKKITEAYEVLKNPEARKRYDALGHNYEQGQPFTSEGPWQNVHVEYGDLGGSGFSSFFEQFFGGFQQKAGRRANARHTAPPPMTEEALIEISLEEAMQGAEKEFLIQDSTDRMGSNPRQLRVKIPPGATQGARIRLRGQGSLKGDLVLIVRLTPHPRFRVEKRDLFTQIAISPWEAALGASIKIPTLNQSTITLKVPPGTESTDQLRLKGKGLPAKNAPPGDLMVEIRIAIPKNLSAQEKELFEKLKAVSAFNPRNE